MTVTDVKVTDVTVTDVTVADVTVTDVTVTDVTVADVTVTDVTVTDVTVTDVTVTDVTVTSTGRYTDTTQDTNSNQPHMCNGNMPINSRSRHDQREQLHEREHTTPSAAPQ